MKKIALLLVAIMVCVVLVSCANEEPVIETGETPTPTQEPDYVMDGDDIHITKDGAKLQDMTVTGDLYIDESVGDGEFHLENVTVEGTIYVHGGGANSGYLISVRGRDLIIRSKTNPKIVLGVNTSMEGVQIASDCHVHAEGDKIKAVTVNSSDTDKAISALIKGDLPKVSIESTANVIIDGKVSLMTVLKKAKLSSIEMVNQTSMYYYSCYGQSVKVHGGTIVEAWINAEYCSLPKDVDKIGSEAGVAEVTIGDVTYAVPARPADSQADEQAEEDASEDGDASGDGDSDEHDERSEGDADNEDAQHTNSNSFALEGYPAVNVNGMTIDITIASYTSGTVYVLVEDERFGSQGTTAINVRNGVSAGAGRDDYTVIATSFGLSSPLKQVNHSIDLMSYMGDMSGDEGPPPEDMGFKGYVFIVIEDNVGNLSKVYEILA